MKILFPITLLILFNLSALSQNESFFRDLILKVDTLEYSLRNNSIKIDGRNQLFFKYDNEDEVCEVHLVPSQPFQKGSLSILPSGDFELIDSLLMINPEYYRFKIRFRDLNKSDFLKLSFRYRSGADSTALKEIPLFASTNTYLRFYPVSDELYIGEEKVFELVSNNPENIQEVIDWQTSGNFDYRITTRFNQVRLHVIPKATGRNTLRFTPVTKKPFIEKDGKIRNNLAPFEYDFLVKQSRLRFLNTDRQEITMSEDTRMQGTEIQMDYQPGMEVEKTYRVENQEAPGGPLIAEIFVKSLLANNRILCLVRPYNYHRTTMGYLYIKEGDKPKFITNFNITPKTTFTKISILRSGSDWSTNLNVNPGDVVDIRIEGEALHKSSLRWEDVENLTPDSAVVNENLAMFKIRVPLNVNKRRIELYNHGVQTGQALTVREFQVPRDFDYVKVNFGDRDYALTGSAGMFIHDKTIRDIVIDFDRDLIDSPQKIYGKQYLKVDIKITGRNNELIELQTIENIVVVPSAKSPRSLYYNMSDATPSSVSLNKYLRKKTFDLEDWAKIELTFQNVRERYEVNGFRKDIVIYLQKPYTFDIGVSFPSGLLINTFGPDPSGGNAKQYQNFGGVSMAMIAQFSFHDADRPGKFKPYRVGAGFLALNTFNLSNDNANRDLSLVVLGTLSPTRRDLKLTFPLYLGGGYKLNEGKWFVLLGPGISVRL